MREEKLTEAFLRLLEGITVQEVESKEALQAEMDRFRRLSTAVLGSNEPDGSDINLHNFAKYIFTDGTGAEKRALIACLEQAIYLKSKEVTTESRTKIVISHNRLLVFERALPKVPHT